MTKEELAAKLDGRQYQEVPDGNDTHYAKDNNLLIVYGASDDLCEFVGAINDEFDCFDGGEIKSDDLPSLIEAVWSDEEDKPSWSYKTDIPHAEFKIYDDDELYCIGMVIDLNEVTRISKEVPSPESLAQKMLLSSQKGMEISHIEMDDLMADTLEALGYSEAVKIFRKANKWYA